MHMMDKEGQRQVRGWMGTLVSARSVLPKTSLCTLKEVGEAGHKLDAPRGSADAADVTQRRVTRASGR